MVRKTIIFISFFFLNGCANLFNYDMDACPQNYFLDTLCVCQENRFNPYQSGYDYGRYSMVSERCSACTGDSYYDDYRSYNGYPSFYGLNTSSQPTYRPYTNVCGSCSSCKSSSSSSSSCSSCNNSGCSSCGNY